MQDDQAKKMLWLGYVTATKGKRQVTTSRGLSLVDDEEIVLQEDEGEHPDAVASLGPMTIKELDRRELTCVLLDAAEMAVVRSRDGPVFADGMLRSRTAAVRSAVRGVLETLKAGDWRILDHSPPSPPQPTPPPPPPTEPEMTLTQIALALRAAKQIYLTD